jgi:hypothetical protein
MVWCPLIQVTRCEPLACLVQRQHLVGVAVEDQYRYGCRPGVFTGADRPWSCDSDGTRPTEPASGPLPIRGADCRVRRRMMTWKRHMLVVMLMTIATIGIGGNSASAAAGHQVPFSASYSGTAAFTSPTTALLTGTGHASHLGRSTNVNHITVSGPGSPGSCPGGFANINVETLTAANGDTLVLTGPHDQACPTGPNAVHGTGDWNVTGGTGRFAGATGQGTFDGVADFNHGTFSFRLTGTISVPGSN